MKLLFVDDSGRLQRSLTHNLRRHGHAVDTALDGESALRYARHDVYDVIILDRMLPKVDGLTVLKTLRDEGCDFGVLLLTAMGAVDERVEGLCAGADDYLVKPFAFDELLARLNAINGRRSGLTQPLQTVGEFTLDRTGRQVLKAGVTIPMSRREYMLFEYLARNTGKVVGRRKIEDHLYDESRFPQSNAVDRMVCSLRKKLTEHGGRDLVRSRRGEGYYLIAEQDS